MAKKFKLQQDETQPETTQQPETAPEETTASESLENPATPEEFSASEPDWENVPLPEGETEQPPQTSGGIQTMPVLTPEGFLTYDVFHEGFCKAFHLGGHLSGLETLLNAPQQKTCPDATRAIYDIALDTPALHFLIKPGSIWMQRAFAIGSFVVPVSIACAHEVKARTAQGQKKPETAQEQPEGETQHAG